MNNEILGSNRSEQCITPNLHSPNLEGNLAYLMQQHTHTAGSNHGNTNINTSPHVNDIPSATQQIRLLMEHNARVEQMMIQMASIGNDSAGGNNIDDNFKKACKNLMAHKLPQLAHRTADPWLEATKEMLKANKMDWMLREEVTTGINAEMQQKAETAGRTTILATIAADV